MSGITCPRCGSPVAQRGFLNAGFKPFCSRCGWNLERAEAMLNSKGNVMKLLPIPFAVMVILIAFAAVRSKSPTSAAFFLIPLVVFGGVLLVPVWSYYSTRKAIAAARFSVNPDLAQPQSPLDPALQQLQSLSRPRRVQFRFGSNATLPVLAFLTMVILGFGVFLLTATRAPKAAPHPAPVFPLFLPVFFVLLVFAAVILIPILRDKRYKPLLRDGELVLGRVTSQQMVQQGKASFSRIDYEFKTSSGQLIQNSVRDLTRSVYEDMTVPVFYDPLDPSKNVPLCATNLRISSDPF